MAQSASATPAQGLIQIDAALARGACEEAIDLATAWVGAHPGHVPLRLRLVSALLRAGHFRRARQHALEAAAKRPERPELVLTLARQLIQFLEADALVACTRTPGFRRTASAQDLAETGVLLSNAGAHADAVQLLELALQRDPKHAPSLYFRGNLHMFAGELDAAERSFERCLAADPRYAQASWVLSTLRPHDAESDHVPRIEQQLRLAQPGFGGEIYLNFALFNELHDLGRHAEAWTALERACAAKRRRIQYEHAASMEVFARLTAQCDARFMADAGSTTTGRVDGSVPTPIFIVGMHRTGTTLLERILAGHPEVTDGGETYGFNVDMKLEADHGCRGMLDAELIARAQRLDFPAIGRRFLARSAARAGGRSWLTEKLPSNFLNIGYIAKALPNARILHLVRDPMETCFSNLRTLFAEACGYSYTQAELADHYLAYRELMAHWHRLLPGRIHDVDFLRLTTDTQSVTQEVLSFCGLPYVAATLDTDKVRGVVATASTAQVRRKVAAHGVAAWTHYREQLGPLRARLAAV